MLSTRHRWKAPKSKMFSPRAVLSSCSPFPKLFYFIEALCTFQGKLDPPPFFVVGRPRSHSQRPRKVEQLPLRISFMISVRPPGKATVRTTDIQVFGMCFSPILDDGLATSGESLKRYMACADSPFPRRSLGDRCRRPPGHRTVQPSRKYSRDVRAPAPWGIHKTGRATKKKSERILQRIVN